MDDAIVIVVGIGVMVLVPAILTFVLVVGVVNLVHRLATGRFFRWFGRPVLIGFTIYLAVCVLFLYALFSSPNAFLITH